MQKRKIIKRVVRWDRVTFAVSVVGWFALLVTNAAAKFCYM